MGEEALGFLENNFDESVGLGPSLGVLSLRGPRPCRRPARTPGQGQGLLHTGRRASWAGTVSPGPRGAGLNPVHPAGPKPQTGLGLLSEARAPRVGQEGRSFGGQAAVEGRVPEPPGMVTQASGELSALLPEAACHQPTPGLGGGGGWVIWGRGCTPGSGREMLTTGGPHGWAWGALAQWSRQPEAASLRILAFSLFRPLCSGSTRRPSSAAVQASV